MQENKEQDNFEKRFKECDDKFNAIFKLTSVASKIIRSDLTILKVNKALCELLGYPPEQIEGTKILDHACEEHIVHWHRLQEEIGFEDDFHSFVSVHRQLDREVGIAFIDVSAPFHESPEI